MKDMSSSLRLRVVAALAFVGILAGCVASAPRMTEEQKAVVHSAFNGVVSQSMRLLELPLVGQIEACLQGKTRLVFLDACRDDPVLVAGTRRFSRGLAAMRVPEGTLIAYAARATRFPSIPPHHGR